MKTVKIQEISNGFTVVLFDMDRSRDLDKTIYCKDWDEVFKTIKQYNEEDEVKQLLKELDHRQEKGT